MARRRGKKIPVHVTIQLDSKIYYGFACQQHIHERLKKELGQTAYEGKQGVFFGANSPKPPRATKVEEDGGTVSSFCSSDKVDDLKSNDWTVTTRARRRGIMTAGRTRTVFVEMPGGYRHAWNLPVGELDLQNDLGFEIATGATKNLIWGINDPKPPRASKRSGGVTKSTFIAPKRSIIEKAVGLGWTISSTSYDLIDDTAAPQG